MSALQLPREVVAGLPKPLLAEHERLVGKHRAAARELAKLESEVHDAEAVDAEAEQTAARSGRKLPAATAPAVEAQLVEAERREQALARAVLDTRRSIIDEVGDELLDEVADRTRDAELTRCERALELLSEFENEIAAANREALVRLWAMRTRERARPFEPFHDSSACDLSSVPSLRVEAERRAARAAGDNVGEGGFRLADLAAGKLSG
jgi:hypothetical protein